MSSESTNAGLSANTGRSHMIQSLRSPVSPSGIRLSFAPNAALTVRNTASALAIGTLPTRWTSWLIAFTSAVAQPGFSNMIEKMAQAIQAVWSGGCQGKYAFRFTSTTLGCSQGLRHKSKNRTVGRGYLAELCTDHRDRMGRLRCVRARAHRALFCAVRRQ